MELKTQKVYVPTNFDLEDYNIADKVLERYLFTKEELERVIRFVYNSAIDYENQSMGSFLNDDVPNLNTLINQILK